MWLVRGAFFKKDNFRDCGLRLTAQVAERKVRRG